MRRNFFNFSLPVLLFFVCSCSTPLKSTLLTSGISMLAGASVGAIANGGFHGANRPRNMAIGASIGAALGAGLGFLGHQYISSKERETFEKNKSSNNSTPFYPGTNPNEPVLMPPKIESRYVEDQIRGNVFVPAHWEFQIIEHARWDK